MMFFLHFLFVFSALHFLLVYKLLSLGVRSSLQWAQMGGGHPSCPSS